jgi:hypothetical protein
MLGLGVFPYVEKNNECSIFIHIPPSGHILCVVFLKVMHFAGDRRQEAPADRISLVNELCVGRAQEAGHGADHTQDVLR